MEVDGLCLQRVFRLTALPADRFASVRTSARFCALVVRVLCGTFAFSVGPFALCVARVISGVLASGMALAPALGCHLVLMRSALLRNGGLRVSLYCVLSLFWFPYEVAA